MLSQNNRNLPGLLSPALFVYFVNVCQHVWLYNNTERCETQPQFKAKAIAFRTAFADKRPRRFAQICVVEHYYLTTVNFGKTLTEKISYHTEKS